MDIQVGDEGVEEVLITRVTVVNPFVEPLPLPGKYRCLFRGDKELSYGRHVFRFPITHTGYKRLVSSFQSDFMGRLRVEFGSAGIHEV